jgi:threonine/homoserine/homoserine lactone efflux protein
MSQRIVAAVLEALLFPAIRWGSVVPLLLISLAIMGSPGPATISLIAAGSVYGVRRSLPYLAGIIVGTTIVLVAVATGITAALLAVPAIGSVLIGISAAYILWLAYHIATAPPLSEQTAAMDAPLLAGGALLGIANPKAWVAIAAVFASAHLADSPTTDAAAKIAVLTVMIIVICATWLFAGTSIAPVLRDPRRARVVNAALAVGLVAGTALGVFH